MTPENLLTIADTFCEIMRVRIRDFGALAAASSVVDARFHGARVYDSHIDAARGLEKAIIALKPLTGENEAFGKVAAQVYLR